MIAIVGYAAIVVALGAAGRLAYDGLASMRDGDNAGALRRDVAVMLGGAAVAMLALEVAIVSHDFSIEYVALHSATTTPLIFLLAGAWAALEGSIVLWGLVLAGFAYVASRRVDMGDGLGAGAMGIIGLVAVFWFGMMATVANPFRLCTEVVSGVCQASAWLPIGAAVAPLEGLGPNPLLQNNLLMAIHPPMLYLGYVGLTVPYAFAMAALLRGDQGTVWLERTHRWSVISWTFLTFGIVLGAWWSYEVLGWGGYWAWDPVENAAFLPWLVATAFIHSAIVQRRRGMLQAWNLILVIAAFALTIFGTFLTRSGTIFSVHSFTQSAVGPALLGFLGIVIIASMTVFAMRSHLVASSPRLESLASREGAFLVNNLLLTLFAFTVLIGTMYPLLIEALSSRDVSVGRPFFDRATMPIAFALLLAMGIGPITPYRLARAGIVWGRIRTPVIFGLFGGAGTVLLGVSAIGVVVAVMLATFVIAVLVNHYRQRVATRVNAGEALLPAMAGVLRREPGYWGGQISHLGVALVVVGIAASTGLAERTEVRLEVGEAAVFEGYCIVYDGPFRRNEPNRVVDGADIRLLTADCARPIALLQPRVNQYPNAAQAVATPAVKKGWRQDVYLTIVAGSSRSIVLDVFVFPLMWVLWTGGLITVLGGLWAFAGVRFRPSDQSRSEVPPLVSESSGAE